jgi:hypothetical protein
MTTLIDQLAEINKKLEEGVVEPIKTSSEIMLERAQSAVPSPEEEKEPKQEEGATAETEEEASEEEPAEGAAEPTEEEEAAPTNATGARNLRLKNKELKKSNEELRERMARIEGMLEAQKNQAPPPVQPTAAPQSKQEEDPEPNPIYEDDHKAWKQREEVRALKMELEQQKTMLQAIAPTASKIMLSDIEKDYMTKQADYVSAKGFLRDAVLRDAKVDYPDASDPQLTAYIDHMEITTAAQVSRSGRNPADYFYKKALARGYKVEAPEEKKSPPKSESTGTNLDAIRRNKEKSAGFIGTPSRSTGGKMTSAQMFDITVEQFSRLTETEKESMVG